MIARIGLAAKLVRVPDGIGRIERFSGGRAEGGLVPSEGTGDR
jgi:hypothetical protein